MALQGKNRITLFEKAAERLVSRISALDDVCGIVFLGGLTRGYTDKDSDLDIVVFTEKKQELVKRIQSWTKQEAKKSDLETDVEIHGLDEFKHRRWNETDRWDFSNANIVFDPTRRIRKLFDEKLKTSRKSIIDRLAVNSTYMCWYCCPSERGVRTIAETWVARGDLASAHYCVSYAIELLLETVFVLNQKFLPPPKWRAFYFKNLAWLPKSWRLMDEVLRVAELTEKDLQRRLKAMRKIWTEIVPKIGEFTGLSPRQLQEYYVKRILHQTITV